MFFVERKAGVWMTLLGEVVDDDDCETGKGKIFGLLQGLQDSVEYLFYQRRWGGFKHFYKVLLRERA